MLRSVDGWEGEHFLFGAASAAATAAPTVGPTQIAIDNGSDGPSATIPDSHLLFTAQFSRAGADLVLTGEDGKAFAVHDYFATDARAKLLSAEGAALSPDVVAALAGPLAPGQYAQAGTAQPSVKAVGRVVQADGDATIVRNGVAMAAHAGDAILKGDVLQTVTGTFGVTFNDGSTLNLTANSRLVVNEFVYDPKGSANSQLLDLVQGSLTFISGEVAHNGDMKIGTPVATMAIRGTVGGVTTANDGTVNFYVSQSATGAVILDSRGTVIANVVQDGPLIIVRPVGPLQVLAEEVQKSPAQLATELAALQQIVSIQSVGQQIIQQFFQQDPNANPNPQSTDKPHTTFQIDLHTNNPTGPNGTPGPIDGNPAPPTSATVTQTTTDGDGNKTTTVEDVKIPANLAPLTFGPLQQAANEDTALVFSSAHQNAISVFDADTASLTVTVAAAHGVLSLSGVAGLTFTSGDGSGDATMTFSGTQDAINAALEGMSFTPAAEYSGPASVSVTTTDGHSTSATDTIAITVAAVNDAPVIAQPNSPTMAYTENQAATAIDAVLTLSDVDSAALSGAKVTISGHFHANQDVLSFADQNGITGSYDSACGVLTLSGVASVADYQAALRSVAYSNTSDDPSANARTISYQVDDGSADNHLSNVATASVTVAPVNDVPVLDYFNLTIAEGGTTVLSSCDFHISDPDSSSFFLSVTGVTGGQFEVLTDGHWVAAPTGGFTADDIAAGDVRFVHDGSETVPAFSIWASDGTDAGAAIDPTVDFTHVNHAPVVSSFYSENFDEETLAGNGQNYTELQNWNVTSGSVDLAGQSGSSSAQDYYPGNGLYLDLAGSTEQFGTLTSKAVFAAGTYVLEFDLAGPHRNSAGTSTTHGVNDSVTVSFGSYTEVFALTTAEVLHVTRTVTLTSDAQIVVQDMGLSGNGNIGAIFFGGTATSIDAVQATSYVENSSPVAINPDLALSDIDSANLASATITLTNHQTGDLLSVTGALPNGISASSYDANTGVLLLTGLASVAAYETALHEIGFSSNSASAADRVISVVANDGAADSNTLNSVVHVTVVNEAPMVDLNGAAPGVDYATTGYNNNSAVHVFGPDLSVTDDGSSLDSVSVVVALAHQNGFYTTYGADEMYVDMTALGGATGTSHEGDWQGLHWVSIGGQNGLSLDVSGTADIALYDQLLAAVNFKSTSSNLDDRVFTLTVNDGTDDSTPVTSTVHLTEFVDHAPVVGALSVVSGPPTDGWSYNSDNGHWYMLSAADDIQSWTDAQATAHTMGGYLATVTSQAENDFLYNLVHSAGIDAWIGASDDIAQGTTEGHWIWAVGPEAGQEFWQGGPEGTPTAYANWNGGEPNNAADNGENYAYIRGSDGAWNDYGGNNPQWYAVEWNGVALDGAIAFTDADSGDTHVAGVTPIGQSDANAFSLNPTVTEPAGATPGSVAWHFDMTSAEVDSLSQFVTQSYDVAISDNHGETATQQISVTVGTNGADNFVFNANSHLGADTVANFNTATDHIYLDDLFANEVDLNAAISSTGGNAIIDLGTTNESGQHDTVTIANVTQDYLQQHLELIHLNSSVA